MLHCLANEFLVQILFVLKRYVLFGMPTKIRAFAQCGQFHDIEVEDNVTAYAWYNIAGSNGSADARTNKDIIAKQMTREQIAEAQKLSRELLKQIEERQKKDE